MTFLIVDSYVAEQLLTISKFVSFHFKLRLADKLTIIVNI